MVSVFDFGGYCARWIHFGAIFMCHYEDLRPILSLLFLKQPLSRPKVIRKGVTCVLGVFLGSEFKMTHMFSAFFVVTPIKPQVR